MEGIVSDSLIVKGKSGKEYSFRAFDSNFTTSPAAGLFVLIRNDFEAKSHDLIFIGWIRNFSLLKIEQEERISDNQVNCIGYQIMPNAKDVIETFNDIVEENKFKIENRLKTASDFL